MTENKRRRNLIFLGFFLSSYLTNMLATGCAYLFFTLSESLRILGAPSSFTMFVLDISRVTLIFSLFLFTRTITFRKASTWAYSTAFLSLIAFWGFTTSMGAFQILFYSLLFGLSSGGGVIVAGVFLQKVPHAKKLRIFGVFSTSYSLGSVVCAFLIKMMASFGVVVRGEVKGGFTLWKTSWPWDSFFSNPQVIFLVGVLLSLIWIFLLSIVFSLSKKIPDPKEVPIQENTSSSVPFLKSEREGRVGIGFLVFMAFLVGVFWVSLMDIVPGYVGFLGLLGTSAPFFAAFGIFAILGRFCLLLPFSRLVFLRGSFTCYFMALVCLGIVGGFSLKGFLFLSGAFLGLGHGMGHTILNILFTDRSPTNPLKGNFAYMGIFNSGAFGSFLLTFWISFIGYGFVLGCLGLLLGIGFWGLFKKRASFSTR